MGHELGGYSYVQQRMQQAYQEPDLLPGEVDINPTFNAMRARQRRDRRSLNEQLADRANGALASTSFSNQYGFRGDPWWL